MNANHTLRHQHLASIAYRNAKKEFLAATLAGTAKAREVRGATSPEIREAYLKGIQEFGKRKGREQYFNYLASGIGSGPFVFQFASRRPSSDAHSSTFHSPAA